jgi:Txe/YoeB family toxin of Txe-Axe toxin-antitoxin module
MFSPENGEKLAFWAENRAKLCKKIDNNIEF